MKRRELRENVFKLLFASLFSTREEMPEQLTLYLDELENADETAQNYIRSKVGAVLDKEEEIDKMLNEASIGWKTSRMNKVDLSILRLAVYEALFDEDVPKNVAVNEAVELGKRFGSDESGAFINGVLGKIVNAPGAAEEA